jgi:hypothetical protein
MHGRAWQRIAENVIRHELIVLDIVMRPLVVRMPLTADVRLRREHQRLAFVAERSGDCAAATP